MSIFKKIDFISHAGNLLKWKIDCDDLTDEDLATLAVLVSRKFSFNNVMGIPTGGTRFANALTPYITKTADVPLIVDDVLTTGKSMTEFYQKLAHPAIGVVIFSRVAYYPVWVYPIFELNGNFL